MKNKIAEQLRKVRLDAGMGQAEMAVRIGVSQSNYSKYERGLVAPSAENYLKFCKTFKQKVVGVDVKVPNESILQISVKLNFRQLIWAAYRVRHVEKTELSKEEVVSYLKKKIRRYGTPEHHTMYTDYVKFALERKRFDEIVKWVNKNFEGEF